MNYSLLRIFVVGIAAVTAARVGRADEIVVSSSSESISPGTPADELELINLGIDPGSFVFTENTQYDFKGTDQLSIVSTDDPVNTGSLNLGTAQTTVITLGESSQSSQSVPEPSTLWLCLTSLCYLLAGRFFVSRRSSYSRSGASFR